MKDMSDHKVWFDGDGDDCASDIRAASPDHAAEAFVERAGHEQWPAREDEAVLVIVRDASGTLFRFAVFVDRSPRFRADRRPVQK